MTGLAGLARRPFRRGGAFAAGVPGREVADHAAHVAAARVTGDRFGERVPQFLVEPECVTRGASGRHRILSVCRDTGHATPPLRCRDTQSKIAAMLNHFRYEGIILDVIMNLLALAVIAGIAVAGIETGAHLAAVRTAHQRTVTTSLAVSRHQV